MLKLKVKDIFFVIMYAIPNTALSFGTLYIINNAISGNEKILTDYMWIVFLAVIGYSYLLNIFFQKKLNQYTFNILYENQKNIFNKILNTSLIRLQNHGTQRFYTAIEDVRTFGSFPSIVTHTINSLLMLIICLTYMFFISLYSGLIVLGLIFIIAAIFFIVVNSMSAKLSILRKKNEDYYSYVNDVIRGFKELKVDRKKRENLMNKYLIPNRDLSKDLDFQISFVFLSINLISQYGLYFVIGAILFLFPHFDLLTRDEVGSYVVILLFISGPINNLINMQKDYSQYIVANNRIKKFFIDFENEEEKLTHLPADISNNNFDSIELKNITFNYKNNKQENVFGIGPINFKITSGEVIFIIGGNGSGKSTFINILTNLYKPESGEIILKGQGFDSQNSVFSGLVTAIFTENHLFSKNYDDYLLKDNDEYKELLNLMHMENIVEDDEEDSARRSFSKGQSKRMSLIFALLENKPILVLDEWAADQDPHFRKYFYESLIPILKEQGKTIIAVTHDDAYFKYADRIVKFDYGQIIMDKHVTHETELDGSLWH